MNTLVRVFAGFVGILYCLLMPSVSAYAKISHGKQSDTSKECAICHFRWVETFFTEHRGTPLAPLQTTTVVGDKEMCLSCHDGTITDSRDKICNDPGHREGTIPSSKVRIPDTFPLSEEGALMCSTCHTPHALKDELKALSPTFLRAPNNNSSFCKLCHTDTRQRGVCVEIIPSTFQRRSFPPGLFQPEGFWGAA